MVVGGYRIEQRLGTDHQYHLYRARCGSGRILLLKAVQRDRSSEAAQARLRHEFEVHSQLDAEGLVRVKDLVEDDGHIALLYEDPGGHLLDRLLDTGSLPLETALEAARQLAVILAALHQHGYIHRDLRPCHILVDPQTTAVRLMGLGCATQLAQEWSGAYAPDSGTALRYLSPEQTGRINRRVDQRTDFYSLGLILFEMLTGQPPFVADDPLALVHAHLARPPPAPSEVAPLIPQGVSGIVLKLLAKAVEERYQSGYGIAADLDRCLCRWRAEGTIEPFTPGEQDLPVRLELPQRLYGRRVELEQLIQHFAAAARGTTRVLWVAGYPGVGKTALIQELRGHVFLHNGFFATGKYAELECGTPYSGILQALAGLVRRLLSEPQETLERYRTQLQEVLGTNLGVIVEIVPELKAVVGETPAPAKLEPVAAKNRLHWCVYQFLDLFAGEHHPLVLFLDDLQWIDSSSLELLKGILGRGLQGFLLLGAYRDNQVNAQHPLLGAVAELRDQGVAVEVLNLRPLHPDAIGQWIADALRVSPERAASLAGLVYQKTAGNPFFARLFLTSLYEQELVKFVPPAGWQWEPAQVMAREATANVIDLAAHRISQLPEAVRQLVTLAALLGSHFPVANLAALAQRPVQAVEPLLIEACRVQILVKQDADYRFAHDRIQESACALLPEAERLKVHLRIARLLAQHNTAETNPLQLFEMVNHLNRAAELLTDPAERERAVRLHLSAGRQAKAAAAFPAAFNYLANGLALLGPEPWREHYDLALALHGGAAEAAYLSADFPTAERLANAIHRHARTLLERIPAFETQALVAYARQRVPEAIAIYLEALRQLGLALPAEPTAGEVKETVLSLNQAMEAALATDLQQLRPLTDPAGIVILRLLAAVAHTAAWSHLALLRLSFCKMIELTLEYGYGPQAPFAFIGFGMTRCAMLEDLEGGERVAVFGLALLDYGDNQGIKALCQGAYSALIQGRRTHPAALAKTLTGLYKPALESGDLRAAGAALYQQSVLGLVGGTALAQVEQTIRHSVEEARKIGQQLVEITLQRLLGLTWALQGGDEGNLSLLVSPAALPQDLDVAVRVAGPELMIRHLFRQHQAALEAALASEALPQEVLPAIPFDFYRCLIFLDRHPLSATQRELYLAKAAGYRQKLLARSRAAPTLYQHKVDLVEAEWRRAHGQTAEALGYYAKAIEGARRSGFVHEEAIAHELAAECYLTAQQPSIAVLHLQAAAATYGRWGARAKLQQLYRHYPALLSQAPLSLLGMSPESLDLASVERAAGALDMELDLPRLLERLMAVLLQHTGAQRGFLLGEDNGSLRIEAYGAVDPQEILQVPQSAPLSTCQDLPKAVVYYVSRSLQTLVLGNAGQDERFAADPYIVRQQPKSILCTPILNQGKPVAFLYLENNQLSDAFMAERLAAVQLICSQAAVALENARLHKGLKQEIAIRRCTEDSLRQALAEINQLKNQLEAEHAYLQEEIKSAYDFEEIVGHSEALRRVLHQVEQVAATGASVLLLGETGTGKELIARAIHSHSPRKDHPLIKVNCAALPAPLIESELFGHEKGAFTGALARKLGRFELADGSTLFLDEIGDLPQELQAKLLRVLQDGEFERLGSTKTLKVNVRVISATNRDLAKAVTEGGFRSDLYYRLGVFPIHLPPLRERREDIPLLVWYFITTRQGRLGKTIKQVPKGVMDALTDYPWPGNVRELENVIERTMILSPGSVLALEPALRTAYPAPAEQKAVAENLAAVERAHILSVLEQCHWRIKGAGNAAERLGLHPNTLRSRMKKLGIGRS